MSNSRTVAKPIFARPDQAPLINDGGSPVAFVTADALESAAVSSATDVFAETDAVAGESGPGAYLWSDAKNWSAGVPGNGGSVMIGTGALDDIAGLTLATLAATSGADLFVDAGLSVDALAISSGGELVVDGQGGHPNEVDIGSITTDGTNAADPAVLAALGAGAVLDAKGTAGPALFLLENGGEVVLGDAPDPGSEFTFLQNIGEAPGTLAFADPGATVAAKIDSLQVGDVLELPGSAVTGVSFGANSVTVTTDLGSTTFSNVTFGEAPTGYTVARDAATGLEAVTIKGFTTFAETDAVAGESGPGAYLWSDAKNWSAGVPGNGGSVMIGTGALDDIAGLTLATLAATSGADLFVDAGLSVDTLAISSGGELLVDGQGGHPNQVDIGSITTGGLNAADPAVLGALGAGAVLDANGTAGPALFLLENGGKVVLGDVPDPGSEFTFLQNIGEAPGTIAFADPGATVAAKIDSLQVGDVLELPGNSVSNVSFGTNSVTVTTDLGTTTFSNVTFAEAPTGYTVARDAATGLEAVTIKGFTTFAETDAAAGESGPGAYLWSDAKNWSAGVPGNGGSVMIGTGALDDIAGLTLATLAATSGADLFVDAGLSVDTLAISSGGELVVDGQGGHPNEVDIGSITSDGTNAAVLAALGAGAVLDAKGTAGPALFLLENGGKVVLGDAPDPGSEFTFLQNTGEAPGTLAFADPGATVAAKIDSLQVGDVLELPGNSVSNVSFGTNSVTVATDRGATTFSNVTFGEAPTSYTAAHDASTGLEAITFTLCFCKGSLIRTPSGDVAVESLSIGDSVVTWAGQHRPITWIGVGQVLATRGRRTAATPVIVRKGALAPNVPHADLRVTKGHSFFIDNVLIPVEFLVNHRSILWDDRAQEVVLYHIELATHDILIANGAPAESYRDDGNRWLFRNANSAWDLEPQEPCAPVLTRGAVVDRAWRWILDRTGPRQDFHLTNDPGLHLLVDGHRLEPMRTDGTTYLFHRPAGVRFRDVRIVSRAAAPDQLGLARDPRVLGVAVQSVTVLAGARYRTIDAADHRLIEGFHPYEPDLDIRWTDGEAALPDELFYGFDGPADLLLRVNGATRYRASDRQTIAA